MGTMRMRKYLAKTGVKRTWVATIVLAMCVGFLIQHISEAKAKKSKVQYIKPTVLAVGGYIVSKDKKGVYHRILTTEPKELKKRAKEIAQFVKYNNKKKRKSLYIAVPPAVVKGQTKLISSMKDYSNGINDKMLKYVKSHSIETYDLREDFKSYPLNTVYYRNDPHWTVQSGFRAAGHIAKKVEELFEIETDDTKYFSRTSNYKKKEYKRVFVGSYTRDGGTKLFPKTNFGIYFPKWETKYTLKGYDVKGKLKKTYKNKPFDKLINYEYFNSKKANPCSFFNGYVRYASITNLNSENDTKVLLLGTSFIRTVAPYLSNYFKQVDMITTNLTEVNVKKVADKLNPDVILYVYTASSLHREKPLINTK